MMDLNDAGCRRRRRRQLANLASLSEEVVPDTEQLESISSFSSGNSNLNDSSVLREVRATMAIGSQLGSNFRPNDDMILGKMIELEAQEYSNFEEHEAQG